MSQTIVECPICEGKFMIPPNMESTQVICPNCNRQVDLASNVPVAKPAPAIPTARPAPSDQVSFSGVAAAPAGSSPSATASKPADDLDPITGLPKKLRKKYVRTNRKKKSMAIVWMVIGFLATIGIIAAIMISSAPDAEPETPENPPLKSAQAAGDEASTDPAAVASTSSDPDAATPATTSKHSSNQTPTTTASEPVAVDSEVASDAPVEPPPRPVFSFHSRKSAEACWQRSRPHLVLLKIEDPRGTTYAAGTLVDSRGYVLTSYNAIKDAWEIEVTGARKPLDENQGVQPFTDLARGIVATDPQNDLALLSVNRRFIVSFASVGIIPNDKIVSGEFLLLCGPPTAANYFGKSEAKVDFRGTVDQLDPAAAPIVESMKLTESKLPWFKLNNAAIALPGTPAFRIDGTLATMCVFREGKWAYAVPANLVKGLIAGATGEVQMLKPIVRQPDPATVAGSDGNPGTNGGTMVANTYLTDTPITDRAGELEKSIALCQQFDWLPTTMLQYTALQQFTRTAGAARDFVVANRADAEDFASASRELIDEFRALDSQMESVKKEIYERLKKAFANDYASIKKVNEFAKTVIEKKSKEPIVFYGELFASGTNPVLKLDEPETYYQIRNDESMPVMYPESYWMYFVEIKDDGESQPFKVPGQDTEVKVVPADFRMAISPSDRP